MQTESVQVWGGLTPRRQHRLEGVLGDVGAQHLDEGEVLQHGLDQHPEEGDEDEVVQQDGHRQTHAVVRRLLQTHQQHHLGTQQCHRHVEQSLLGPTLTQLPGGTMDTPKYPVM